MPPPETMNWESIDNNVARLQAGQTIEETGLVACLVARLPI